MTLAPAFRSTFLAATLLALALPAHAEDTAAKPAASTPAAAAAPAASGDEIVPTARIIATVNGEPITELDLVSAQPDLQQALARLPQDQQFAALLKGVIDIRLMARAAEAAKLDKDPQNASILQYTHDRALRNVYLQDKIGAAVTDAAIKARYDTEVAKFVPQDEIHAVHILVKTEDEAKAIIAELDKGTDFDAVAKEKTADASKGAVSEDLGFFGHGYAVKPFDDAAFALGVREYTKTPVKSDFGWHVIKVLEKRKSSPPTFEARRDALGSDIARDVIRAEIEKLHAAAKIDLMPGGTIPGAPDAGTAATPSPAPAAATPAPAAGNAGSSTPAPAQ